MRISKSKFGLPVPQAPVLAGTRAGTRGAAGRHQRGDHRARSRGRVACPQAFSGRCRSWQRWWTRSGDPHHTRVDRGRAGCRACWDSLVRGSLDCGERERIEEAIRTYCAHRTHWLRSNSWTHRKSSRARYACLLSPSDVDLPLDCPVDHDGELFDRILKSCELRV